MEQYEAYVDQDPEEREGYVKEGFWKKVKKTASKVPFIPDAVAMYFCALDTRTPIHAKIIAFTALAYFILPLDAVPDVIPVAGYADDAAALTTALGTLQRYITEEHREKAQKWLKGKN